MANQKSNSNRINKQREIELNRRKKRKVLLIILFIIIILIVICAYLLTAEVFKIQNITISGNTELSQEDIYNQCGINIGDNIFLTQEVITKVKLKQNGYIEDVKLKKIYPNKIEIEVKERKRKFQILTKTGCYIYINEQGYILDYSLDKLELPTILGMEITEDKVETIKRLEENDLEKMENILQIQAEAEEIGIKDLITEYQVTEDYVIVLGSLCININFGDATNLKNRMFYVKAILEQENGSQGTIYINGNLDEGFTPYFRAN